MSRLDNTTGGSRNSGHALIELLLVMSLSGVLTATGMHLLHGLMRRQQMNTYNQAQAVSYRAMIDSLQGAYDRCCRNPFSREPWLWLETGEGNGWYPLQRLELLVIENNEVARWQWEAPERALILVNYPTGHFASDAVSPSLRIKFPESSIPVFREGIAIEGIGETVLLEE